MAGSRSASIAADPPLGMTLALRRLQRRLESPRTLVVAVLLALPTLGGWAALAPVDQVVRVEGRIVPAGRAQQIQHLEGGIVAAIHAGEGQTVRRGDLLLTIDATSAGANLDETTLKLDVQQARAARLEAEVAGAAAISFPAGLGNSRAMNDEKLLFATRRARLEQELRVFDELVRQKQAEAAEIEGRRHRLSGELETARQRSALVAGMAARNAASRLEVLDAQSREQRLATELADSEAALPKIRAGIAEARARAEETRAQFRSLAHEELVAAKAEVDRLGKIATAQEDRVSRTEVRAPADGVINRVTANTVGGVVKPGEMIVELTPTTRELLIEAQAKPSDRGEMMPGQRAKVRVSAHDSGALGTLSGVVRDISADTVQDGRGDYHYRVVIRVDQLPPSYADKLLAPGMTVTGDIVTGRRTVARLLLSPIAKFTDNAFRDSR